jgi:hypothetical protein
MRCTCASCIPRPTNFCANICAKTIGSVTVEFLYDLSGHPITELSSTGGWNRGEVYAGARHLATYSGGASGTTYFVHSDWLGTERARVTYSGAPYESCSSLPFGDHLSCVRQATLVPCTSPAKNATPNPALTASAKFCRSEVIGNKFVAVCTRIRAATYCARMHRRLQNHLQQKAVTVIS